MSLSGEKERSDTASKRSLSGDREEGATASTNVTESPIQKERPVSPVPSCLSMKSDKSMGHPIEFQRRDVSTDHKNQMERPDTSTPSCLSMKSDKSMGHPIEFQRRDVSTDHKNQMERPDTSTPSCLSMKSDKSMGHPIEFQRRDVSTDHKNQMERPDSSTPSCLSMKSVKSIGHPIEFRDITIRQRDKKERSESEVPSGQSSQSHQTDLSSIFRLVEKNAIALVKRELKKFKKILCPDLPECFESQTQDKELVDAEDVEQESIPREGALKITLHILRKMNQKELADTLENSLRGELAVCQNKLKSNLKRKCECVFEGIAKQGNPTLLNKIYTELYITEGGSGEVNKEHEVRQIETTSKRPAAQEKAIKCNDIFESLPGQDKHIRTVLTKGVAGIGKTISVQKFILDWAEGRANHNIQLIFPLPFRELNLMKDKKYSLMELLHHFFNETAESEISNFDKCKVLFAFDGLDECRLPLDFNNEGCCDVTESTSVDVLLTNLIKGNLLPSALLWITSRPAAANQIPPEYVDQVTEVRGFSDPQKEEYFKKRFSDVNLASRIITHMKTSRSLYIMCHIPVFSWISATVLEKLLEAQSGEMPKTLTEMYNHFLICNILRKTQKYPEGPEKAETDSQMKADAEMILKLGKLAFQQLEKGNLIFYEEDLRECSIDVTEASVYSGVCTQIFREESGLYQEKVYCFVHLSIQEFLAAVYVFVTFNNDNVNLMAEPETTTRILQMSEDTSATILHKSAVDKALQSGNGHLDLFLRFLLGLSMESNHTHLLDLLIQTRNSSQTNEETVKYIKEKIRQNPSPERCINLFHCLNELNDHSLVEEIQSYLSSGSLSEAKLSPAQWSALVFVLLTSEEELEVFDLKKYSKSEEGLLRLLPVVKASSTALLNGCNLTERCCEPLASLLSSTSSQLRVLDLTDNNLKDSGVKLLSAGLESPHCKLEKLRLSFCVVTEEGCASLASALRTNPSHLKELDLSYNHPGDFGVKLLTAVRGDPNCRLKKLSVDHNEECYLKSALKKYACELTLDPNTAHNDMTLSEKNRKVTRLEDEQSYPYHPERFLFWKQVLCKERLTGRCYWEVEWRGLEAHIGVAYHGLDRQGRGDECGLGYNENSWALSCYKNYFTTRHDKTPTTIPIPPSSTNRVGVYLDWSAGTLSFYSVSSDTLTHLHTFHTTFIEPLYLGIRLWCHDSAVSLCQIE
ncbi:protein NLRC3-like isoform X6 [Oncorhynchus keta]|uniref:protein NLRC3-like isoform X6 n=1 Tax=Oncorhynchus keta TaxID=8018 RepID=UPI00227CEEFF|nr:protein NLRC3-like isoform X6 [Oncorhynchus keta]